MMEVKVQPAENIDLGKHNFAGESRERSWASVLGLSGLVMASSLVLTGCSDRALPTPPARTPATATDSDSMEFKVDKGVYTLTLKNIERVFMHQPGDYSVLQARGNELKVIRLNHDGARRWLNVSTDCYPGDTFRTQLITDLEPEEQMYAKITLETHEQSGMDPQSIKVQIHMHSPQDLDGTGWQRAVRSGKYTHFVDEKTSVVE